MSRPFVVAGGIVRNRAWCLPRHLGAVQANHPDQLFYVYGDCTDDTAMALDHLLIAALRHDTGEPGWTRDGKEGPRYRSEHMAAERNLWASEALKRWPQATHLWVVDSDVLPAPDVLERLLALKAPVAGAFVPIADGETPIHMIGWDPVTGMARRTGEEKRLTKPHAVTLMGGCYLIDAQFMREDDFCTKYGGVFFSGAWGVHAQGEDGHFADYFRCRGIQMLVDPLAICTHLMERDQ